MSMNVVVSTLSTATTTAELTAADLFSITAETLADSRCTCRAIPTDSAPCQACREADRLASLAGLVESPDDVMNAIIVAGQNVGVDLADLLPGITDGILERGACTCRDLPAGELCPVCSVARGLDDLAREMRAA